MTGATILFAIVGIAGIAISCMTLITKNTHRGSESS